MIKCYRHENWKKYGHDTFNGMTDRKNDMSYIKFGDGIKLFVWQDGSTTPAGWDLDEMQDNIDNGSWIEYDSEHAAPNNIAESLF